MLRISVFASAFSLAIERVSDTNWLPVAERVYQFIAVSVYKFLNAFAPIYMAGIFIKSEKTRTTRSTDET